MSYTKITDLIQKWEEYENLYPEATLTGFGQWLAVLDEKKSVPSTILKKNEKFRQGWNTLEEGLRDHHKTKQMNVQLSILVGRLGRYAKMYAKKSLLPVNLNLEEFTFLASILHLHNPKKSDVILMNLFEPTSGTEILRRLIKLNYVKESASKEDKRSKLMKLTPLGEKMLFKAFQQMSEVSTLVFANLTDVQKAELVTVMEYLNDFHTNLYLNHKEDSVEEMLTRYVPTKKNS